MTQYNKRYILSTYEKKIEINYARFNKLSNDAKVVKNEVILLKVHFLQSTLLFNLLFYTLFCSLSQNKLGQQYVPFVVLGHKIILELITDKCLTFY